jgi:tyrosine-protein phosphatase SIW14
MQFQFIQRSIRTLTSVFLTIFVLALVVQAQETDQKSAPVVRIKNFGQIDDRFFRGAQPKERDYEALKELGIKTVIDLRDDPKEYEKPLVESLGMKYVNIAMVAKKYPTEEAVNSFLKLVGDPETGKFYVHCAGGRHRTGAIGAVYRYHFYNWNFDQVYKEMKQYDFYTSWGHGAFKDFVKDYYERIQRSNPTLTAPREGSGPSLRQSN